MICQTLDEPQCMAYLQPVCGLHAFSVTDSQVKMSLLALVIIPVILSRWYRYGAARRVSPWELAEANRKKGLLYKCWVFGRKRLPRKGWGGNPNNMMEVFAGSQQQSPMELCKFHVHLFCEWFGALEMSEH